MNALTMGTADAPVVPPKIRLKEGKINPVRFGPCRAGSTAPTKTPLSVLQKVIDRRSGNEWNECIQLKWDSRGMRPYLNTH